MGTEDKTTPEFDKLELNFSELARVDEALETEIESSYEAISKIITDCEINGVPILGQVLSVAQDRTTLKKLARVIDKIADKVDHYYTLKKRKSALEVFQEDSTWLGGALGSFDREVDAALDQILADIERENTSES